MSKNTYRHPAAMAMIAALSAAWMLCACNSRELCYDHTHWLDLRVEFDWSLAPEADPRTMVVYLFPTDGEGEPRRYELSDFGGTLVRIPAGEYNAVTFNGDTETLTESGNSYDKFLITTPAQDLLAPMNRTDIPTPPRAEGTEKQPVKTSPDRMWSGKLENISIKPMMSGQTIRFSPVESTVTLTIKIVNVINMNPGIDVSGALSSLAESYHVGARKSYGDDVTMPLTLEAIDSKTYSGTITVFGHCAEAGKDPDRKHILTIYTSNRFYYHYDVTDQLHRTDDPDNIVIVIDGIKLPDLSGTGLNPEVSDWSDVVDQQLEM